MCRCLDSCNALHVLISRGEFLRFISASRNAWPKVRRSPHIHMIGEAVCCSISMFYQSLFDLSVHQTRCAFWHLFSVYYWLSWFDLRWIIDEGQKALMAMFFFKFAKLKNTYSCILKFSLQFTATSFVLSSFDISDNDLSLFSVPLGTEGFF